MKNKITTEEFIKKAIIKHGDKYDYQKTQYIKLDEKVIIICKEHGDFWQLPSKHLYGQGCKICGGSHKPKIDEWICKAEEIHNNIYDYSKVEYVNAKTPIVIICKIHGEFKQTPDKHIQGQGCRECGKSKQGHRGKKAALLFISKSQEIHGKKYNYSNTSYIKSDINVVISCEEHGDFYQTPDTHLSGAGCPKCAGKNKTLDEWIDICKRKHGNYYSYEKTKYTKGSDEVIIICPKHGDFYQIARNHMIGKGCQICGSRVPTTIEWIEKAKSIHGELYDYSKSIYTETVNTVSIICPIHGEFYQRAGHHLEGRGCRSCGGGGYDKNKSGYFYIQILDAEYIKFGITNNDPSIRMKNQEEKSVFKHKLKYVFRFENGLNAIRIESNVKKYFKNFCGIVDRNQMPDGYTETMPISKLTLLRIKVLLWISLIKNKDGMIEFYFIDYEKFNNSK